MCLAIRSIFANTYQLRPFQKRGKLIINLFEREVFSPSLHMNHNLLPRCEIRALETKCLAEEAFHAVPPDSLAIIPRYRYSQLGGLILLSLEVNECERL
jgi:hypothetical protein